MVRGSCRSGTACDFVYWREENALRLVKAMLKISNIVDIF